MSLRKLSEFGMWSDIKHKCVSPEHNPPNMMALPPGAYEWTCPACGARQVFHVDGVVMDARKHDNESVSTGGVVQDTGPDAGGAGY